MRKILLTKFNAIAIVFILSGLSISISYNQAMGSSQQFPTQQFPFPFQLAVFTISQSFDMMSPLAGL
jgi:hypothetical protein